MAFSLHYNPNKNLILNYLKEISKNLDIYSSIYDNFILLGDPNSEPTESAVRNFCEICSYKNLIKDNTCFKNPLKPSWIDLVIINEFEKWRVIRASAGGMVGVLVWVTC